MHLLSAPRRRLATLSLLALALAVPAPAAEPASPAPAAGPPRLVLVVAVDQLRRDRVGAELPGGLGRLVREGASFPEAALAHAVTETCPGHATLLTGLVPARTGVPSNSFVDTEAGRRVYCVEDAAADARVFGGEEGRSPRTLRVDALGDWMKAADPRSRVFAVSGKDRAAVMLAGRRPDAAYWFRRGDPPTFTTSGYYAERLPDWVVAWNGASPPEDGFLAELPETWSHASEGPPRADAFEGEGERFARTSPHPLRADDLETFAEQLYATPHLDELTLQFARRLVEEEDLGGDEAPDLLAVGLSATDVIGHHYGPFSREAREALLRLDAAFGDFLSYLEERVGKGRVLVALSADHGVMPLPEWLSARGEATCPDPDGRTDLRWLGFELLAHLHLQFSPLSLPGEWLVIGGSEMGVNRQRAAEHGVAVADVVAAAKAWLERQPAVAHVFTADEIAAGESEMARLYRNSFVPGRSGDLVVQVARGCLVSPYDGGTTHGSPWDYDRDVPLVFWGSGVPAGPVAGPAASVDMGTTLAAWLGIPAPAGLDGRALLGADAAPVTAAP